MKKIIKILSIILAFSIVFCNCPSITDATAGETRGDIENRSTVTTGVSDTPLYDLGSYVTPEQYGACGDGVTDDTAAIQAAVDSGKNVLFDDSKTYYIPSESYITINQKSNFIMSGGTFHKAANVSNVYCFVITNCTGCVFQDMYIYSEFTQTDTRCPKDHTRPTGYSSNVLAFAGYNNDGITFLNNSFDRMDSDYWISGTYPSGLWQNVVIDGWKSSTSIMPLYSQCVLGLEIKNANVSMSETHAGDGDHCLYLCELSWTVRVHDCYFSGSADDVREVLLTFHGGNATYGSQPKDIIIYDCTVDAVKDRAMYSGMSSSIIVRNCTLTNTPDSTNMSLVTGDASNSFNLENCILKTTGVAYCFNNIKTVNVDNCSIIADI